MEHETLTSLERQRDGNRGVVHEASVVSGGVGVIDNRESTSRQRKTADLIAQSLIVRAQRALLAGINESPRVVAQRKQLDSLFGTAGAEKNDARSQRQQLPASRPDIGGIPHPLKAGIESLSGMAMDHVRVHYNSSKPAQLNALAYAQGSDIHLARGQETHLPHEAWHVVQQAQGRVQPTTQMKDGMTINDNRGLEREADAMGATAAAAGRFAGQRKSSPGQPASDAGRSAVQLSADAIDVDRIRLRSLGAQRGGGAAGRSVVQRKLELIAGAGLVSDGIPRYKALYGEATTRELFLVQDSGKVYLAITALTQAADTRYGLLSHPFRGR
jgi:hypothetical protein